MIGYTDTEEYAEIRDKFFAELDDKLSKADIAFKAYEKGYEQAKTDILEIVNNLLSYDDFDVKTLIVKINQLGRKGIDE